MENKAGIHGAVPDELITMTRENLQAERDAWYENGLRNGQIRAFESSQRGLRNISGAVSEEAGLTTIALRILSR